MPRPLPELQRWSLRVDPPWSLDAWRGAAREALLRGVLPEQLDWITGSEASLLDAPAVQQAPLPDGATVPNVPRDFVELAATCLCHRDPQRLPLLYRLLWRIAHGERTVLSNPADADVLRLMALAQAVRRDTHKMKAFVRFREVPGETDAFIAWFEPDHNIVDRVAPFFARRFAGMRWAILTPARSVRWDGSALSFGDGGSRRDAPAEDARETLWQTYYASIFNPARLNTRMMQQEMPARYWKHLPEAHLLPGLVRDAAGRVQEMHDRPAQAPQRRIPARPNDATDAAADNGSLQALRQQAAVCRQCPLWEASTQTVFGEGRADARIMLVGEQPGDVEDLSGRPFAGPAGKLLDRALQELGIERSALYLTNAVKHFHHERRGKLRLHKRPESRHVHACRPWLQGEIARVKPQVIVCLGATAASSVFGHDFNLTRDRGRWLTLEDGTRGYATVHPAWVLRQKDETRREDAYRLFRDDLRQLLAADSAPTGHGPASTAGRQAASIWFSGRAAMNASSCWQAASMRRSVGYGARSRPNRCALYSCGIRQMSARPGRSPWQNVPVSALSASIVSIAAKPSAIQCRVHCVRASAGSCRSRSRYCITRRLLIGWMSQATSCASARTRARPAASAGSSGTCGNRSSRYSRIASDWVSTWPSCSSVGTSCCGLSPR